MSLLAGLTRKPWIWSWLAAFAVWFLTIMVTGGASTLMAASPGFRDGSGRDVTQER